MKSTEYIVNEINKLMNVKPHSAYECDIKEASMMAYFSILDLNELKFCSVESLEYANHHYIISNTDYISTLIDMFECKAIALDREFNHIEEYVGCCDVLCTYYKSKRHMPNFIAETLSKQMIDLIKWLDD